MKSRIHLPLLGKYIHIAKNLIRVHVNFVLLTSDVLLKLLITCSLNVRVFEL